jgi:peptidoglycan/LPS O-acetylase OafA/YrhL
MSLDPTAIIWSLSIEEQFYLVWPLLLLVCLSLRLKRKHLIIGLIVVIVTICFHRRQMWAEGAELNRLYYGTDTRADAPLMGCLLALIPQRAFTFAIQRILKFASLAASGILIYLAMTVHFTDTFLYRGGYTGVALLSGIITLTAALQSSTWFVKILEWPPLRFFGRISYGLYLWHWLLLQTTSFYYLVGPTLDPWARCLAAILISALSFYLIEIRFNRLKTRFTFTSAREKQKRPTHPVPGVASLPKTVMSSEKPHVPEIPPHDPTDPDQPQEPLPLPPDTNPQPPAPVREPDQPAPIRDPMPPEPTRLSPQRERSLQPVNTN